MNLISIVFTIEIKAASTFRGGRQSGATKPASTRSTCKAGVYDVDGKKLY